MLHKLIHPISNMINGLIRFSHRNPIQAFNVIHVAKNFTDSPGQRPSVVSEFFLNSNIQWPTTVLFVVFIVLEGV